MLFEGVNNTMLFSIISFVYMLFFTASFVIKKKVKSIELTIFKWIIIVNLLSLTTECLMAFLMMSNNSILYIILKIFNILIFSYVFLVGLYCYVISKNLDNIIFTIRSKIYFTYYILICIGLLVLPVKLNNVKYMQYSYGPSVNLLFISISVLISLMIILMLCNFHNIKKKKAIPIIALVGLIGINAFVQYIYPNILLVNSMFSLITFLMFFTIENPDIKMIEQLNIARDQADKANNAKSEFLSSMSHEIRTPLNAIVGFSQALKEEELTDQAKDEVNDIMSASESLLEIVNGILDISKIEANKLEIVNKEYSFKKIYHELCNLTKARLGDKPLELRFFYDETIPDVIYGDSTRIKQIILNLLTNSVKYTKEGYVEFKVNSVTKNGICRLIVSVEDSGIGIKEDNIDKLFSKFERFDLKENITIEGTGLGLAITKKLIDLMNGKIVVQSVYGKGSRFTIAIDQKIVEGKTIEDIEEKTTEVTKEMDLTGKKIIIVDDNSLNLKVASRLLKIYNSDIETLDNGYDLINKIKNKEHYDLILLDDMMPKISGKDTLKELKNIPDFNIPTVVLTANAIEGMKEGYLNAGFDDYLSKPIDKNELNRIITKFFSNK